MSRKPRLVWVTVGAERPESRERHQSDGDFDDVDFAVAAPSRRAAQDLAAKVSRLLRDSGFCEVGKSHCSREITSAAIIAASDRPKLATR